MDMIRDRLGRLGKGNIAKALFISVVCASVFAAGVFIANSQPWVYISPPALSTTNFSKRNAVAYTPWFETGSYRGDVLALPVDKNGLVSLLTPI